MTEKESRAMPKIVIGGVANGKDVEEFYKILEEEGKEKKFDNYIIAYIDFLGIKEKMNNDSSFESLQILKFLLSGTQRTANYISDISMKSDKDKIQKYVQFYLPKEILSTKYIV